jgi:hypothetical protein
MATASLPSRNKETNPPNQQKRAAQKSAENNSGAHLSTAMLVLLLPLELIRTLML